MKLLAEIDDHCLGLAEQPDSSKSDYSERHAARAIIFNTYSEIAFLHAQNYGYYKLPGGGIEQNEDWQTAIRREAIEETGHEITLRPQQVGKIIEWRAQPLDWCGKQKLKQISYCGIGDITGITTTISLAQDEIDAGLTLIWITLSKAVDLILQNHPNDYEGKFIQKRDLTFLQEAAKILA